MDERLDELLTRLCAPGPKAGHVSASECHEIHGLAHELASNRNAFRTENADLLAKVQDLEAQVASDAAKPALDKIAELCACPDWDYPGQVVRDVELLHKERNDLLGSFEDEVARTCRLEKELRHLAHQAGPSSCAAFAKRNYDAEQQYRKDVVRHSEELKAMALHAREWQAVMERVGKEFGIVEIRHAVEMERDVVKGIQDERTAAVECRDEMDFHHGLFEEQCIALSVPDAELSPYAQKLKAAMVKAAESVA